MTNVNPGYSQTARTAQGGTVQSPDTYNRPTVHSDEDCDYDRGTESKSGFKTTEFIVYILAVIGVLVASYIAGGDSTTGTADNDFFGADQAWILITALTIGYMVSRGLAKSGGRYRDA